MMEVKEITMDEEEVPLHNHPLIPFTHFFYSRCKVCYLTREYAPKYYIYGGYRCNEAGCDDVVFHKDCTKHSPEISHSSHPDHPLKLIILDSEQPSACSFCGEAFGLGYCCSICDFKLDLRCARRPVPPLVILENSNVHEHPLELFCEPEHGNTKSGSRVCSACQCGIFTSEHHYRCKECYFIIHLECADVSPEAEGYHTCHPQHPLKSVKYQVPDYADKKCLLCGKEFNRPCRHHQPCEAPDNANEKCFLCELFPGEQVHHCDVCNFSICRGCMKNPPPVGVESLTTHEHRLHLVPRLIEFTCNACGTLGDRSPYFCLECNFMIHQECIDLPRVININRHDDRIAYTRRLGHGKWKCGVCRKEVDGFYGAYSCSKCSDYVVHSRCATSRDVWDLVELEGTTEEEIIPPFEVIDDNTIKHLSHDHNLRINKDGPILHETTLCVACALQIISEPFYSCEQCHFILHERCANLPRKKRHVCHNQRFTLLTDSQHTIERCDFCGKSFSGFRYKSVNGKILDVSCGSISEPFVHGSHPHLLYYSRHNYTRTCSGCGNIALFSCDDDECDFSLCFKCARLPQKVMRHRYDDHPLSLSYGESSVDGEYWCEACETELNSEKWFYTCNDCGITLHISCVVGDFSYIMPGSVSSSDVKVVSNTSVCRALCDVCNSMIMPPTFLQDSKTGVVVYICSSTCRFLHFCRNDRQKHVL